MPLLSNQASPEMGDYLYPFLCKWAGGSLAIAGVHADHPGFLW
ncbi:hypothetical protein [Sphingobacterium chuzhouense]|nr:hypothetical protein [Sphingobacterium chuzhouense]